MSLLNIVFVSSLLICEAVRDEFPSSSSLPLRPLFSSFGPPANSGVWLVSNVACTYWTNISRVVSEIRNTQGRNAPSGGLGGWEVYSWRTIFAALVVEVEQSKRKLTENFRS